MINQYIYNDFTKSFSIVNDKTIANIKFGYNPKSRIAIALTPIVMATCFKWTPMPSIYGNNVDSQYKKRQIELMNKLKQLHKEVPVLKATKFENACYVGDFDQFVDHLVEQYGWGKDDILKEFADEWGLDFKEFKAKLGPDMVFLGIHYTNAPILAHEFGHYMNGRGKASPEGKKYHDLYSSSYQWGVMMGALAQLSDIGTTGITLYQSGKLTADGVKAAYNALGIGLTASGTCNFLGVYKAMPVIKAETYASRWALKELSDFGVEGEELKEYKDSLIGALGTYKKGFMYIPLLKGGLKIAGAVASQVLKHHTKFNGKPLV